MCVFDVTTRHILQTCMCGYVCFMNGGAREQCVPLLRCVQCELDVRWREYISYGVAVAL